MRAQREPDLLCRPQLVGDLVERSVEGGCTVPRDLPQEVGLRLDVRVQRALLDAHRFGEIADRGAVVALLGEEPRGLPGELVSTGAHVGYPNDR